MNDELNIVNKIGIIYFVPHRSMVNAMIQPMLESNMIMLKFSQFREVRLLANPRPPKIKPKKATTLHPVSKLQPQQHWFTLHILSEYDKLVHASTSNFLVDHGKQYDCIACFAQAHSSASSNCSAPMGG